MSSKTLLTTFSFSHSLFEHMDCGFGSLAMDSRVSSGCCGGFILLLTQGFLAPGSVLCAPPHPHLHGLQGRQASLRHQDDVS